MANQISPLITEIGARLVDKLNDTKRSFANMIDVSPVAIDIPIPASNDDKTELVLSNLQLLQSEDMQKDMLSAGKQLCGDGLFLASTLGSESFAQLNQALEATKQTVLTPLPHLKDLGNMLHKLQFALPVIDRDIIIITYDDIETLYDDLCQMMPHVQVPTDMQTLAQVYKQQNNGNMPLSLEIVYLTGWKPHKSQQQPLKPGTTKVNLIDVFEG